MKHLFIVNPMCTKIRGGLSEVVEGIHSFFKNYPHIDYSVYVTKWSRDALGACRGFVLAAGDEPVRVHTLGGTSTHFEVVNATVDLPGTQLALYPMGRTNIFPKYFGLDKFELFDSLQNQVFSHVVNVDAIRCNHNYGISNVLIGFEALVDTKGDILIEKTHLPTDLCYLITAASNIFNKEIVQEYTICLDGRRMDGEYISIMVANHPWYGENMCPAVEARPDDGLMEVYMTRNVPLHKRAYVMPAYLYGKYKKYPKFLLRDTGRKLTVSSDKLMWLSIDGETFYGNDIECEIVPGAISFVCPEGVIAT